MTDERAIKDDPRTVFGWCMYDRANSASLSAPPARAWSASPRGRN